MAVLLVILALLAVLILVVVLRAALLKPTAAKTAEVKLDESPRAEEYGKRLADLVRMETVSSRFDPDRQKFLDFHKKLEEMFPLIHETCEKHVFNGSLLFRWKGQGKGNPILLMSHHDVVEANGEWEHAPFSGEIDEQGRVWGRGTVDTKASLFCILTAVEEMIRDGYVPGRDVYVASSCTEEWSGEGAPLTAKYLKEQGVKLDFLLDEGGMVPLRHKADVLAVRLAVGNQAPFSGQLPGLLPAQPRQPGQVLPVQPQGVPRLQRSGQRPLPGQLRLPGQPLRRRSMAAPGHPGHIQAHAPGRQRQRRLQGLGLIHRAQHGEKPFRRNDAAARQPIHHPLPAGLLPLQFQIQCHGASSCLKMSNSNSAGHGLSRPAARALPGGHDSSRYSSSPMLAPRAFILSKACFSTCRTRSLEMPNRPAMSSREWQTPSSRP